MTITKAQTTRLLTQLSGKEAFLVIMQGYVERTLKEAPTFTDPEIERMMDAMWSNPQRAYEYRRMRDAHDVMQVAMYEGRIAALNALNAMQGQMMLTNRMTRFHSASPPDYAKITAWAAEDTPFLQRQHHYILHCLEWYQLWRVVLEAFDTVFSTRMVDMLTHEAERLEMFTVLYHDRMEWYDDDIVFARMMASRGSEESCKTLSAEVTESGEDISAWRLPEADKQAHDDRLQRCITYLHQCPDQPFHKVLEVVGV